MPQKTDYQKIIGNNIRQIRNSHNYTIHEFARLLGISEPFLRQIERGEKGLSVYNIITLLNIFNVKFEQLIHTVNSEDIITENLNALNAQLSQDEKKTLALLLKAYISQNRV